MRGSRFGQRIGALALLVLSSIGAGAAADDASPASPRLWADSMAAWIYPKPQRSVHALGYVRAGGAISLAASKPVSFRGCQKGWYPVLPRGFVCHDRHTSFEVTRYVKSMQKLAPRPGAWPYEYALSNHAPMYQRLPTPAEWANHERWLGETGSYGPLSWGNRGHERLAETRLINATGAVPEFLSAGGSVSRVAEDRVLRRMMPLGSMLAYTESFSHAGRTWLLSSDGTVMPADRLRPYRRSSFQGLRLHANAKRQPSAKLPLAWIRKEDAPKLRREGGEPLATGAHWAARTWVALASASEPWRVGKDEYLETSERDENGAALYLRRSALTPIVEGRKRPGSVANDEKWIVFSITRGVLEAYQGDQLVFTTLASPGAGGVPVPGRDPVKWSTTPLGNYRITFKHVTDDMSPQTGDQRSFWLAEVPYAQYFNAPFAVHVAYWHEDFGEPMSAGCVNLSPHDGEWLFSWTEPSLPQGWHGVGSSQAGGLGTRVFIVR